VLVVPASDLRVAFACPRCGNTLAASALVRPSTPLRAVPVAATQNLSPSVASPGAAQASNTPANWKGGKRAWSFATWLATSLGDIAWWLDKVTYGRRLLMLSVFAAAVLTAQHVAPALYPLVLCSYCCFVYLLVLARLWWTREDDGAWTWRRFADRGVAGVASAFGSFQREDFSVRVLLEGLRHALVAVGLALVVLAPPLAAVTRFVLSGSSPTGQGFVDLLQTVQAIGAWSVLVGFLSWVSQRFGRRAAATVAFKDAAKALATPGFAQALPFVLDVRNAETSYDALPLALRPLAITLSEWRPREQEREAGYERSLVRFLKKRLPGVEARTQQPFEAEDGSRGRIDVVVDDVLAIELKRGLRASAEADRAVGQIFKYAASWKNGPVILVLCEASWDFAQQPMIRRLAELHALGRAVFVVAAGRVG
jgi:hypothetical protein